MHSCTYSEVPLFGREDFYVDVVENDSWIWFEVPTIMKIVLTNVKFANCSQILDVDDLNGFTTRRTLSHYGSQLTTNFVQERSEGRSYRMTSTYIAKGHKPGNGNFRGIS